MHWLATLPFAVPVAAVLAIAWANRGFQPLGWLAWSIDAVVRMIALVGTILLCIAGWAAWKGGYAAVVAIDWTKWVLVAALTAAVLMPVILLPDLAQHVKRRRKAQSNT
jgi:uncharacterized membrane protein